ncbi:MAG: hypothetical protein R2699_09255 [Acidimicrobiales bacterium]
MERRRRGARVGRPEHGIVDGIAGGSYEAIIWRQFRAPDPDGDYQWWVSPQPGRRRSTSRATSIPRSTVPSTVGPPPTRRS